jgi:hypothetical protein
MFESRVPISGDYMTRRIESRHIESRHIESRRIESRHNYQKLIKTKPIRIPQQYFETDRLSQVSVINKVTVINKVSVIIVWTKNDIEKFVLCGLTKINREIKLSIQTGNITKTETNTQAAERIVYELTGITNIYDKLKEVRRRGNNIIYFVELQSNKEPTVINTTGSYYIQDNKLSRDFERPMILSKDHQGKNVNTGLCWIPLNNFVSDNIINSEYVESSYCFLDIVDMYYEFFYGYL